MSHVINHLYLFRAGKGPKADGQRAASDNHKRLPGESAWRTHVPCRFQNIFVGQCLHRDLQVCCVPVPGA